MRPYLKILPISVKYYSQNVYSKVLRENVLNLIVTSSLALVTGSFLVRHSYTIKLIPLATITNKTNRKRTVQSKHITATLAKKINEIETQDWIYVTPRDNMWTVRKGGAERAFRSYKLKVAALNAAKKIIQPSINSHIIVFDAQGEISKVF